MVKTEADSEPEYFMMFLPKGDYEVGTRNYGRFLLGFEPLPAIY